MTAPHCERSGRDLRLLRASVFAAVCVVLAAAGHTMASCAAVPLWTLGAGFLGVLTVVAPLAGRERSLPGIAVLLATGQTALHTLFGLGQHTTSVSASAAGSASAASSALSDATLVERAARLVCGATAAAISPARAQQILIDARLYPGGATGDGTDMSGMAGMGAAHHRADALTGAGPSMALLPSLPMLLGHVLAAVAAGWLLRRGDTALLRLLALSAHGVAEAALVRSLRGALALVRVLLAGLPTAPGAGPRLAPTAPRTVRPPRTTALRHSVTRRGPPDAPALVLAA
ncbi:hypothetical protein [Streptomyces asoensis]|uniref:Integral membrane protein n=1 Tax=Streptomyces asoensis TaxID=249586 RepID=A0ABQ3S1Q6_9ACTN|nr:hypothetical protein [Streptomyces asoensis]GGQ74885.1 hypothetical protein GCM10010496_42990 [Streptomyces asoensis]GHI62048.1 hypothetical protein Saso_36980 [Streptomyces asoensis]